MKVILFSKSENTFKNRLITTLEAVTSREDIETYTTVPDLSRRLKIDTSDISIVLLLISEHHILNELLKIRSQLIGHRIIIILPNQRNDTLSKAHSLYPRFISYKDNNFGDLRAVIEKMLSYLNIHSKMKSLKEMGYPWMTLQNQAQVN